jgi:hypothetical protein
MKGPLGFATAFVDAAKLFYKLAVSLVVPVRPCQPSEEQFSKASGLTRRR